MMELLRRARSAGLGVLLATQSPGDFDYKCRDNIGTWFVGRVAEKTAVDKMKPLLADHRGDPTAKLAGARIGEFFLLANSEVTELKMHRPAMETRQLGEEEILTLARATRPM